MTKEQIQEITSKAKQPCLIGMRMWDKDVQQFTCKAFNGNLCTCYKNYKNALDEAIRNTPEKTCQD